SATHLQYAPTLGVAKGHQQDAARPDIRFANSQQATRLSSTNSLTRQDVTGSHLPFHRINLNPILFKLLCLSPLFRCNIAMAFNFNWSPLTADSSFYLRAQELLTTAINKSPKPPIIVDDIIVNEL